MNRDRALLWKLKVFSAKLKIRLSKLYFSEHARSYLGGDLKFNPNARICFLRVKPAQRESESHFETHKSYLSRVYWECLKGKYKSKAQTTLGLMMFFACCFSLRKKQRRSMHFIQPYHVPLSRAAFSNFAQANWRNIQ